MYPFRVPFLTPISPPPETSIYTFSHKIKSNQGVLKVLEEYRILFLQAQERIFQFKETENEERNNQSEYA